MTQQQEDFKQAVGGYPSDSFILQALAGTGKTTTLLAACPTQHDVLALAFNKRIQEELAERFPKNAKCQTFNSLGHKVWMQYIGSFPQVDQSKMYGIVHGILKEANDQSLWEYMSDIMDLANTAKAVGIVPKDIVKKGACMPLVDDDEAVWEELADDKDLPFWLTPPARDALRQSISAAMKGDIDFADQLYMPVVFRGPFPRRQYGSLIVDEAQDLGPLEHKMVELCLGKRGRLIAAGDHHQAIYGWRGAHADSMSRLQGLTDATEMPLTVSFRCPRAIVEHARSLVPEYEASPDAIGGSVDNWQKQWDESHLNVPNAAVLCRNNKPLFILAINMIQRRIPCRMQGRDIGRGLKRIIKQLAEDDIPSAELAAKVESWMHQKMETYLAKGDQPKATKVEDQAQSILAITDTCATSHEVIKVIDDLFGPKAKGVTLSTIHKAKGLEWDHVFILDKDLIGKQARAEWARVQEKNLHYVAMTRAMQSLTYLESQ